MLKHLLRLYVLSHDSVCSSYAQSQCESIALDYGKGGARLVLYLSPAEISWFAQVCQAVCSAKAARACRASRSQRAPLSEHKQSKMTTLRKLPLPLAPTGTRLASFRVLPHVKAEIP